MSPLLDVLITLLQWGVVGWRRQLAAREALHPYLVHALTQCAETLGERVLQTPGNPISVGLTLDSLGQDATFIGSMLFSRCASGARVISPGKVAEVAGMTFQGYGASCDAYPHAYMTVAAAIGTTEAEVDEFLRRLTVCVEEYKARRKRQGNGDSAAF